MGKCSRCGKSGLFLKLNESGLCKECVTEKERQAAEEREKQVAEASSYISHIKSAYSVIPKYPPLLAGFGYKSTSKWLSEYSPEKILEIQNACKVIFSELPRWSEYPVFSEVFLSECVPAEHLRGYVTHPVIDAGIIGLSSDLDFDKIFEKAIKNAHTLYTDTMLAEHTEFQTFRVVGVTFKNGRRSRQTILRQIYYRDPPYQRDPDIRLEKYEFEGEPAFAVYTNNEQIGNIGKDDIPFLLERWDRYREVTEFSISGGGDRNFGIEISVKFSR